MDPCRLCNTEYYPVKQMKPNFNDNKSLDQEFSKTLKSEVPISRLPIWQHLMVESHHFFIDESYFQYLGIVKSVRLAAYYDRFKKMKFPTNFFTLIIALIQDFLVRE